MFSGILLLSGLMVISARNPVHSVLFLILGFFNAAGLFVLLGAEFIAMILVIVYVGAVAVLFLFVVMMLDINFEGLRKGVMSYLPVGALVGLVLLTELIWMFQAWKFAPGVTTVTEAGGDDAGMLTNTHALGQVLYTDNVYLFQAAGIILLIAMIGAITLTLRTRPGVHRQSVPEQLSRRREDVVTVEKVETGSGVS